MSGIESLLFAVWQLVNSHDGFKPLLALIFGGETIYVLIGLAQLPEAPVRTEGAASTPIVRWKRGRRNIRILAFIILAVNAVVLGLYLRVWFFMKEKDKPTAFPAGHHLPLLWGTCLTGAAVLIVLGLSYLALEKKLKAAK